MNSYTKFDKLILILTSSAFVFTDWKLFFGNFTDYILFALFVLIIFYNLKTKYFSVKKIHFVIIIIIILLLITNILFNLIFNTFFLYEPALQGFTKAIFYLITIIILVNFIRHRKLEINLLKNLSFSAVIISLIGIYITLSIFADGIFPYEFIWEFTRQDLESYTYRGWGRSIIRTRSLFSEPAHLGFYLNTILAILYFNHNKFSIKKSHDFLITSTVILTFSYSAILIMIVIKALYYFKLRNIISLINRKKNIIFIILATIALLALWNTIEKTLLIRTQELLSGTDASGNVRLSGSWKYIKLENLLLGVGIGNSPTLYNIYAYILTDLGIVSFLFYIVINLWLFYKNPKLAIAFTAMNFQKGGYLGGGYWIFISLIFLFYKKVE
ncbi:hypothetical protein [Bacillus sp. Marseille-Q3570]|uniref:hypothetical protein n=1 Tax=Bacillus sp. Marseille-Q3570 TaxID=2963522 RepID=UPI0021B75241|nr:hypothetical protein [Bacillus sp. Marseille-Q3570]